MTHDTHDPEKCRLMFEKLSEYIDNELDEVTCSEIERHMKACINCQVCLATLKRVIDLCKNMKPEPVPQAFSSRLKELTLKLS